MKYDYELDLEDRNSLSVLLSRIQLNSTVLEFGPANGRMTKYMKERLNCKVYAVEIDKDAAKDAEKYTEKIIVDNIENYNWQEEFKGLKFDYIIFADVLEHLYDPKKVLKSIKNFLKDNGSILVSIPNIAHNAILLGLLKNEFNYNPTGLLDDTHIRFFTKKTFDNLIRECKYFTIFESAIFVNPINTELHNGYDETLPAVSQFLQSLPCGEIYQFIYEFAKNKRDLISDFSSEYKTYNLNFIQLYINIESSLLKNNLIQLPIRKTNEIQEFIFSIFERQFPSFTTLRLDIFNDACVLILHELKFVQQNGNEIDLMRHISANHLIRHHNTFFFSTHSPQIYFDPNVHICENVKVLTCKIQFMHIGKDAIEVCLKQLQDDYNHANSLTQVKLNSVAVERNKLEEELKTAQTELQLLTSELAFANTKLHEIHTELVIAQNNSATLKEQLDIAGTTVSSTQVELASLFASASCRVTKPFRDIIGLLKIKKGRWSMKNKLKKLLHVIKVAKERPDWRQKFFAEIKHNGIKAALNKVKAKSVLPLNVELRPSLVADTTDKEILNFPIVHTPLVSIVIPVYNQFDFTYKCLKSILENTDTVAYEIIIADDVSSDETLNLAAYVKNITIVRNKKNLGFLLNCNHAAKFAKGSYIHFLNNDTQVQKEWLSSLVTLIESNEKIGMVGSKLVYPDGRLQEAGGIIWKDASGWNYGRLDDPMKPEYNYVKEVDYISGASIMIRKSLWEEIGGFDRRYVPAYYEDADLAFEVRKRKYQVMYEPKSVVVHFEGISNGIDTQSGIKHYQVKNHEKFLMKWKDILDQEHFDNAEKVFLARDRSFKYKKLLFIDHYVPLYDQDAGSKAVFHYLEEFRKQNIMTTFIGDNFYHYPDTDYVTGLQQMGIEVLYGTFYANNWQLWIKEYGHYFDYIILSRPHITKKYIDILLENTQAKLIYFGVDLHYLRCTREYASTESITAQKDSMMWKDLEFDIMRKVNMSCFYSYVEVETIQKEDPSIKVKNIPLYIYDVFPPRHYDHHKRNHIFFVGGFSHTPNIDGVLWFIKDIMPLIRQKNLDIKLYIIGSQVPQNIIELSSLYDDIIIVGRVSDEELEKYYDTCRMSVAPLRFGAGIKGKVVESLYHGIPIVTTSIGAEGLLNVENSLCIADDAESFADHIIELYTNEEKAKTIAEQAWVFCKEHFSNVNIMEILE